MPNAKAKSHLLTFGSLPNQFQYEFQFNGFYNLNLSGAESYPFESPSVRLSVTTSASIPDPIEVET